jgi:hypothetical protein
MRTKTQTFPGLAVVLAAGVVAMAQGLPQSDRQDGSDSVTIQGRVVDDETGDPIEYFSLQKGRADVHDPSKIAWSYPRAIPSGGTIVGGRTIPYRNPRGEFNAYVDLSEAEADRWDRIRVLADGYEPEPVLYPPFVPAEAGNTVELTVRLRRGRSLVGSVVDHAGRPAARAKLCLIRPSGGQIRVVDDVIGEGSDTGLLDPSVTRAMADEQGRFRLTGVGDAQLIGVSAPTFHFWTVPVPPPGEELAIRLPEPATLRIPYAIEGDAPETHIWLHLKQPEDLKQRLSVTRNIAIPNGGEAILRDVPPGEYTLWRRKMLPIGEYPRKSSVEHRKLTLGSGDAVEVSFVRAGSPVSGTVITPQREAVRMLYVGIEPAGDPEPGFPFRRWFDIVACDEKGRFQTAHVPPGDYVVHAAGYRDQPRYEPFGTFNDRIDFTGSAPVTVPPNGNPPDVRIMLDGP